MDSTTNTSLAMGACPSLEDIAAFLDGMLPAEERERIVAHLADCEACYQMFAGAADFLAEAGLSAESKELETVDKPKGKVVPFPFPDRTKHPWWLAAAALVVLGLGVGITYRTYFVQPEMIIAELTDPVLESPGVEEHVHDWIRLRGLDDASSGGNVAAFMVGGLLVDLRLYVQAKDVYQTTETLRTLAGEVDDADQMEAMTKRFQEQAEATKSVADLQQVSAAFPDWERELGGEDSTLHPEFLAFGKWAEAGRVAAGLREPEFFERGKNRRFLRWLLGQPEKEEGILSPDDQQDKQVLSHLQEIARLWDAEERDYQGLATAFGRILDHYDRLANQND